MRHVRVFFFLIFNGTWKNLSFVWLAFGVFCSSFYLLCLFGRTLSLSFNSDSRTRTRTHAQAVCLRRAAKTRTCACLKSAARPPRRRRSTSTRSTAPTRWRSAPTAASWRLAPTQTWFAGFIGYCAHTSLPSVFFFFFFFFFFKKVCIECIYVLYSHVPTVYTAPCHGYAHWWGSAHNFSAQWLCAGRGVFHGWSKTYVWLVPMWFKKSKNNTSTTSTINRFH